MSLLSVALLCAVARANVYYKGVVDGQLFNESLFRRTLHKPAEIRVTLSPFTVSAFVSLVAFCARGPACQLVVALRGYTHFIFFSAVAFSAVLRLRRPSFMLFILMAHFLHIQLKKSVSLRYVYGYMALSLL